MTYRFAFCAFWAAAALAKVPLPISPGAVKGLMLRHLRWWAAEERAGMFHAEGSLSIGFAYPNMYMCEDYNSPQSVYWCLKPFVVLALGADDEFWACEEEVLPSTLTSGVVEVIWPPRHVLVNDPVHHFLLSSGQTTRNPFKGREAKYGKFAYSSAFGFSVPTGTLLHQIAPDSTLAVSADGGESWRVRWDPFDVQLKEIKTNAGTKTIPALVSSWQPWKHLALVVETSLIPLAAEYPGWHVRVHRVQWSGMPSWSEGLQIVDGGFAIASETETRRLIGQVSDATLTPGWETSSEPAICFVSSKAGGSGVVDLSAARQTKSTAEVLKTDPNTNLMAPRTMLPLVKHEIGHELVQNQGQMVIVTGVFASSGQVSREEMQKMWQRRPDIRVDDHGEVSLG